MALSLSRNCTLIVSSVGSSWDGSKGASGATGGGSLTSVNTWEIPVLDGFSFSQGNTTQNVTVNEAGSAPKRGQRIFNISIDPVDFSFTTYVRPYKDALHVSGSPSAAHHSCTEKLLWNATVANALDTAENGTKGITSSTTSLAVDFENSDVHQLDLLNYYFYFSDSGLCYKIGNGVITTADVDFSIDGLAQITWTGQGESLTEVGTTRPVTAGTHYLAAPSTADFINNKLSTCTLVGDLDGDSTDTTYTLAITGGSFTVDNGITWLTPEELGVINQPKSHYTGTRNISGSLTCYLTSGGTTDSEQLLADFLTDVASANPDVTTEFNMTLNVGGNSAPNMSLNVPKAHVTIPTVDVADVMSVTIEFTGIEGTPFSSADEATITYKGSTSVTLT